MAKEDKISVGIEADASNLLNTLERIEQVINHRMKEIAKNAINLKVNEQQLKNSIDEAIGTIKKRVKKDSGLDIDLKIDTKKLGDEIAKSLRKIKGTTDVDVGVNEKAITKAVERAIKNSKVSISPDVVTPKKIKVPSQKDEPPSRSAKELNQIKKYSKQYIDSKNELDKHYGKDNGIFKSTKELEKQLSLLQKAVNKLEELKAKNSELSSMKLQGLPININALKAQAKSYLGKEYNVHKTTKDLLKEMGLDDNAIKEAEKWVKKWNNALANIGEHQGKYGKKYKNTDEFSDVLRQLQQAKEKLLELVKTSKNLNNLGIDTSLLKIGKNNLNYQKVNIAEENTTTSEPVVKKIKENTDKIVNTLRDDSKRIEKAWDAYDKAIKREEEKAYRQDMQKEKARLAQEKKNETYDIKFDKNGKPIYSAEDKNNINKVFSSQQREYEERQAQQKEFNKELNRTLKLLDKINAHQGESGGYYKNLDIAKAKIKEYNDSLEKLQKLATKAGFSDILSDKNLPQQIKISDVNVKDDIVKLTELQKKYNKEIEKTLKLLNELKAHTGEGGYYSSKDIANTKIKLFTDSISSLMEKGKTDKWLQGRLEETGLNRDYSSITTKINAHDYNKELDKYNKTLEQVKKIEHDIYNHQSDGKGFKYSNIEQATKAIQRLADAYTKLDSASKPLKDAYGSEFIPYQKKYQQNLSINDVLVKEKKQDKSGTDKELEKELQKFDRLKTRIDNISKDSTSLALYSDSEYKKDINKLNAIKSKLLELDVKQGDSRLGNRDIRQEVVFKGINAYREEQNAKAQALLERSKEETYRQMEDFFNSLNAKLRHILTDYRGQAVPDDGWKSSAQRMRIDAIRAERAGDFGNTELKAEQIKWYRDNQADNLAISRELGSKSLKSQENIIRRMIESSKLESNEFNNWVRRLQEVLAKQHEVNEALNKALGITEAENTKMKTFAELARQAQKNFELARNPANKISSADANKELANMVYYRQKDIELKLELNQTSYKDAAKELEKLANIIKQVDKNAADLLKARAEQYRKAINEVGNVSETRGQKSNFNREALLNRIMNKYASLAQSEYLRTGGVQTAKFEEFSKNAQKAAELLIKLKARYGELTPEVEKAIWKKLAYSHRQAVPLYNDILKRINDINKQYRKMKVDMGEGGKSGNNHPFKSITGVGAYIVHFVGRSSKGFGSFGEAVADFITDLAKLGGVMSRVAAPLALLTGTFAAAAAGITILTNVTQSFVNLVVQFFTELYNVLKPGIELFRQTTKAFYSMTAAIMNSGFINGQRISEMPGGETSAKGYSKAIIDRARLDAELSAFSFEEIMKSLSGTLPMLLEKGFSLDQAYELNKSVAGVAKTTGLGSNQVLQEMRDLAQGTITARTSQVANALGITNADLGQFKGDVEATFEFLTQRMAAFTNLLSEYEDTAVGQFERLQDRWATTTEKIVEQLAPMFKGLFSYLVDLTGYYVDDANNKLTRIWLDDGSSVDFWINQVNGIKHSEEELEKYGKQVKEIAKYNAEHAKEEGFVAQQMPELDGVNLEKTGNAAFHLSDIMQQISDSLVDIIQFTGQVIDGIIEYVNNLFDANDIIFEIKEAIEVVIYLTGELVKLCISVGMEIWKNRNFVLELIEALISTMTVIGYILIVLGKCADVIMIISHLVVAVVDGFKAGVKVLELMFRLIRRIAKAWSNITFSWDSNKSWTENLSDNFAKNKKVIQDEITAEDVEEYNNLQKYNEDYQKHLEKAGEYWSKFLGNKEVNLEIPELSKDGQIYQALTKITDKMQPRTGDTSQVRGNPNSKRDNKDAEKAQKQAIKDSQKAMKDAIANLKDALKEILEKIADINEENEIAFKEGFLDIKQYYANKAALDRMEAEERLKESQQELEIVQNTLFENDYDKTKAEHEVQREIRKYTRELNKATKIQSEVAKRTEQIIKLQGAENHNKQSIKYQNRNTSSTATNNINTQQKMEGFASKHGIEGWIANEVQNQALSTYGEFGNELAKHALAVIRAESNGNQDAISSAGAIGLGQLMPDTAAELGVNPYDWKQNIQGTLKYLAQLYKQFSGDWTKIYAGYNAGPEAVNRYGGVPPYAETQDYVKIVGSYYNELENMSQSLTPFSSSVQNAGRNIEVFTQTASKCTSYAMQLLHDLQFGTKTNPESSRYDSSSWFSNFSNEGGIYKDFYSVDEAKSGIVEWLKKGALTLYQVGATQGNKYNPNENHMITLLKMLENGKIVVLDPANGMVTQATLDEILNKTNRGGQQNLPEGAGWSIYQYKNPYNNFGDIRGSNGVFNFNNKQIKDDTVIPDSINAVEEIIDSKYKIKKEEILEVAKKSFSSIGAKENEMAQAYIDIISSLDETEMGYDLYSRLLSDFDNKLSVIAKNEERITGQYFYQRLKLVSDYLKEYIKAGTDEVLKANLRKNLEYELHNVTVEKSSELLTQMSELRVQNSKDAAFRTLLGRENGIDVFGKQVDSFIYPEQGNIYNPAQYAIQQLSAAKYFENYGDIEKAQVAYDNYRKAIDMTTESLQAYLDEYENMYSHAREMMDLDPGLTSLQKEFGNRELQAYQSQQSYEYRTKYAEELTEILNSITESIEEQADSIKNATQYIENYKKQLEELQENSDDYNDVQNKITEAENKIIKSQQELSILYKDKTGVEKLIVENNREREKLNILRQQPDLYKDLGKAARESFSNELYDFFSKGITDTSKSFKDSMYDLLGGVLQEMQNVYAKYITNSLTNLLFGQFEAPNNQSVLNGSMIDKQNANARQPYPDMYYTSSQIAGTQPIDQKYKNNPQRQQVGGVFGWLEQKVFGTLFGLFGGNKNKSKEEQTTNGETFVKGEMPLNESINQLTQQVSTDFQSVEGTTNRIVEGTDRIPEIVDILNGIYEVLQSIQASKTNEEAQMFGEDETATGTTDESAVAAMTTGNGDVNSTTAGTTQRGANTEKNAYNTTTTIKYTGGVAGGVLAGSLLSTFGLGGMSTAGNIINALGLNKISTTKKSTSPRTDANGNQVVKEDDESASGGASEFSAETLEQATQQLMEVIGEVHNAVAEMKNALEELTKAIQKAFNQINSAMIKGGVSFNASGGYISGEGTSTSDSIPAMLSNGEYVVNAAAVKKNRPLLEAINSGQKFGIRKFAQGGSVTSQGSNSNTSSSNGASYSSPLSVLIIVVDRLEAANSYLSQILATVTNINNKNNNTSNATTSNATTNNTNSMSNSSSNDTTDDNSYQSYGISHKSGKLGGVVNKIATKLGFGTDQSENRIIDTLGDKVSKETKIIIDLLQTIADNTFDILTNVQFLVLKALFGGLIKRLFGGLGFASGGIIRGEGTSTSDSIPAMLSDGEAVLNAKAVKRLGVNFINAVNDGNFSKVKAHIPKFADGGVLSDAKQNTARGVSDFASSVGTSVSTQNYTNIALVRDEREAMEHFMKSPQGQRIMVDFAKKSAQVYSAFS